MKMIDDIIISTTKQDIEKVFAKYNISSPHEKIYALKKAMGVVKSFPDYQNELGYELTLSKFLEGSWRLI